MAMSHEGKEQEMELRGDFARGSHVWLMRNQGLGFVELIWRLRFKRFMFLELQWKRMKFGKLTLG